MTSRHLSLLVITLAFTLMTPSARTAETAGARGEAAPIQRNSKDFGPEFACARAIMGPSPTSGRDFGKLMRLVTDNVLIVPVSRDGQNGFYLITKDHGARFYVLDPKAGQSLFEDTQRMYSVKFVDPVTKAPYGLIFSVMGGGFNNSDQASDQLDRGNFGENAFTMEGITAKNDDAFKDVVGQLVDSLGELPDHLVPRLGQLVADRSEEEDDQLRARVDDVICTCAALRGSPELTKALWTFKKNFRVAPFTSERCEIK